MSLFQENIKQILAEIKKFLCETLKKETHLSKTTHEHKQQILDKLNTLYDENHTYDERKTVDTLNIVNEQGANEEFRQNVHFENPPNGTKNGKIADSMEDGDYEKPCIRPLTKHLTPPQPMLPPKLPNKKTFEVKVQNSQTDENVQYITMNALPTNDKSQQPLQGKRTIHAPPEVPTPSSRCQRPLPEIPPPLRLIMPSKQKIKLSLSHKMEEDFANMYYGKWDCMSDNSNELDFKKWDIIYIVSKEFDGKSWWIGKLQGKFGLVPSTYLTPAYKAVA